MKTFEELYENRPDTAGGLGSGSSGYSRLKHMYDLCKELNPSIIIESGTWIGQSSYLFRHACPDAKIICHDIQFDRLQWKDDSITYIKQDIESTPSTIPNEEDMDKTLLFFDDHISQKQRIEWAKKMGFKNILFDDNVSEAEAKRLVNPASPTLKMIDFENKYEYKEYKVYEYLGGEKRDSYLTLEIVT
jgi:hypothetical protein